MKGKWRGLTIGLGFFGLLPMASALELDWSGQFWSELNFVHNYAMDSSDAGAGFEHGQAAQVSRTYPTTSNHQLHRRGAESAEPGIAGSFSPSPLRLCGDSWVSG